MREHKYRAWQTVTKTMFYGIEKGTGDEHNPGPPFADYLENKNMIIMQYTCLKDKNGKEIYEGDIVRVAFNNEIAEEPVEYQGCTYIIEVQGLRVSLDSFSPSSLEVIGNIYEHPQLLKV